MRKYALTLVHTYTYTYIRIHIYIYTSSESETEEKKKANRDRRGGEVKGLCETGGRGVVGEGEELRVTPVAE